jgi:gliotoxin/aspirochlorine biosynthesis peptide synthetase
MGSVEPEPLSICDLFRSARRYFPNNVAVEDGPESITYHSLDMASSAFAARILCKGLRYGQPVPILTTLCIPMVVGILGILKAGGVYVPIDRNQWSEHRIHGVLDEIGERLLVYTGEPYIREGFESMPVEPTAAEEGEMIECGQSKLCSVQRPDSLCYIIC